MDSIRIQCASAECEFNSHSNRIQCEKALTEHWSLLVLSDAQKHLPHLLIFLSYFFSRALRTAECIIVLLGQVGVSLNEAGHNDALSAIARTLQQRMFHPVSVLDGTIVTELGKMAAASGDSDTLDILSQLMGEALGLATTPYPTQGEQSDTHRYTCSCDLCLYTWSTS